MRRPAISDSRGPTAERVRRTARGTCPLLPPAPCPVPFAVCLAATSPVTRVTRTIRAAATDSPTPSRCLLPNVASRRTDPQMRDSIPGMNASAARVHAESSRGMRARPLCAPSRVTVRRFTPASTCTPIFPLIGCRGQRLLGQYGHRASLTSRPALATPRHPLRRTRHRLSLRCRPECGRLLGSSPGVVSRLFCRPARQGRTATRRRYASENSGGEARACCGDPDEVDQR